MSWLAPEWLLLLALLPFWVWLRRHGWGQPAAIAFPETRAVQDVFRGGRPPGSGPVEGLRFCVLAALVVALAQPQWVRSKTQLSSQGLDTIVALDQSGSMSALDFEPQTRLGAAKQVLREYLAREGNNRVGLVAFAARAFMVCPLTLDYHVLLLLLDHLEIGMTSDGTAIGMAIAAATNRLKGSDAKTKIIILLTDGRNNAGRLDPLTAAELAAALNIRIYTIGMGSPEGGPIALKDPVHGKRMLLDADGSLHMEQLDEVTLQRIAGLTGGRYFRATDRNKLKAITEEIGQLERARLTSKQFTASQDLGGAWLLVALALLGFELILAAGGERRLP